jgi:enoyl-CoA hydratase
MNQEAKCFVLFEKKNRIAYITINRPEAYNALSSFVRKQLGEKLAAVKADPEIRAAIITGAGEKAFSSGADLDDIVQTLKTPCGAREGAEAGQILFDIIEKLGKPTIAAINGFALGGGCELILACTIRVASTQARIGLPEIHLGIIPGNGGTHRLVRLVGRDRAAEMILTGDMIDAQEAYRIGLVSHVVPSEQLISKAEEIAGRIIKNGTIAVRLGMEAIYHAIHLPPEQAMALESALAGLASSTEDTQERLKALVQKRMKRHNV